MDGFLRLLIVTSALGLWAANSWWVHKHNPLKDSKSIEDKYVIPIGGGLAFSIVEVVLVFVALAIATWIGKGFGL